MQNITILLEITTPENGSTDAVTIKIRNNVSSKWIIIRLRWTISCIKSDFISFGRLRVISDHCTARKRYGKHEIINNFLGEWSGNQSSWFQRCGARNMKVNWYDHRKIFHKLVQFYETFVKADFFSVHVLRLVHKFQRPFFDGELDFPEIRKRLFDFWIRSNTFRYVLIVGSSA